MLLLLASIPMTVSVRSTASPVQDDLSSHMNESSMVEVRDNLCENSIMFMYHGGNGEAEVNGAFKYGPHEWDNVPILQKTEPDGCVKTYIAQCNGGVMKIDKTCPSTRSHEERSLSGLFRSRNTDVKEDESLVIVAGDAPGTVMDSKTGGGRVEWNVIDDAPTVVLQSISNRRGKWDADAGCYCCKKNFNDFSLLNDPFGMYGYEGGRAREAYYGNTCMLAWALQGKDQDLGAFLGTTVYQVFNVFTFGLTQRAACAATCPFRGEQWSDNKYSYSRTFH